MRTDELIVQLAREGDPVQPLAGPWVRLVRWTATMVPLIALAVVIIGPRVDALTSLRQPAFVGILLLTLSMAIVSAAGALVLSVPGAERAPVQRAFPLLVGGVWGAVWITRLIAGGAPIRRLLTLPIHEACILEISGLAIVPGWVLFVMLRRAAPLHLAWSAALATLGGVGLSAAATQVICPIDDPAHQLVGHIAPVVLLAVAGAIAGRRSLNWLRVP